MTPQKPKTLTGRQLQVAGAVAEDSQSDELIAEQAGISRSALASWKRKPWFQEAVERFRKEIDARVLATGVALKTERIKALNTQFQRIEKVIAERAAAAEMATVPGGKTGLLSHNIKGVGAGVAAQVVDVYEFDAALDKARSDVLEQIAKEMGGQFDEKANQDGTGTYNHNRTCIFNFPVASPELLAEVANAVTIDLPTARPRLLTRPSDGKPL